MQPALSAYILRNLALLRKRDFLIEIFSECDRLPYAEVLDTQAKLYPGKLLLDGDGTFVAIRAFTQLASNSALRSYRIDTIERTGIENPVGRALVIKTDAITLPPNAMANVGDTPVHTTMGRLLLNYLVLAEPFGATFPFLNDNWTTSKIEAMLFKAAIEKTITAEQLDTYVQNNFFLGHFTEITTPNYTEKSLTTDPQVAVRRKELLEKNKDALARGDAVVMAEIEAELIKMDKAWLAGDPSLDFYNKSANKAFNVQRKKMLLTVGMVKEFDDAGGFNFRGDPLSQGVTVQDFALMANEIRAASYARALETVDGGVVAKVLSRALQNATILEDDCKTDHTIPLTLKANAAKLYLNRYIRVGERLIELTEQNLHTYVDKSVNIRSPMGCATKGGYCRTCLGKVFAALDQESLTMRVLALSSFFLLSSLKISHGTSYTATNVADLNAYTF